MSISALRPMKEGVIADFDITEAMLRAFIGKVVNSMRSRRRASSWQSRAASRKSNAAPCAKARCTLARETFTSSLNPWRPPSASASG
jgi:hypothetical protein